MAAMYRPFLVLAVLVALFHCDVAQQVQMPEAGALHLQDEDLSTQVLTLQRNISELWTYIFQLRSAVSQHLNHLRQHQVEMEDMVHRLSHYHDGHGDGASAAHTDDHHHSGEQHSHSSDQHSHGSDQHSHSGEHHSHGDDHHHSGEHSHGGDDHSHDTHDHYHDSHSHSHSHSSHEGHGSHSSHEEDGHHHHHDHKDSHEKEDDLQQSQQGADLQQVPQGAGPVAEPIVVPSVSRSHNSHATPGSRLKPLPLMNNYHHHHHHHDHEPRRNRSRVVVMPKYSEYDLYEFAICNVQPNRAISVEQQQEISGQVTLWQRKMGGPLNLHVKLQGFDMGDHHGHHQQVQQEDDNETPPPVVHKHGFHVHSSGDLSNGCQSTGSHYNPKNANHGGPNSLVRHVGDLGNIECDDHGVANIVFADDVASLKGPYSIVGKSIVIHALQDDYGLGGNEESLKTGNAGTRIACCVIEKVDKLPIRAYKAIKTAKQYQN